MESITLINFIMIPPLHYYSIATKPNLVMKYSVITFVEI